MKKERERRGVKVWNDEHWVQAFLAGDQDAFELIIQHYQAYVFAIILNFVDENDASDIAQEVFLQLYRSLPQYKPDNLKAWIGKITTHKAIDWKRGHARLGQELTDMDFSLVKDRTVQMPDDLIINSENRQQVQNICMNLPPRYGRIITKYYYENKSYQQIAREEGINVRTVESRLYRARNLIRQKWKEE